MDDTKKPFAQIETRPGPPLKVICRFDGTPTDKELDDYLKTIGLVYKQKVPFVILYDALSIGSLSYNQLQKQVAFMREHDIETAQYMLKCVIVLTSKIHRKSLDLIFKWKPPACKQLKVVATVKEAKDFLRA